jgi:sulfur-carrier protein adenylyltransferase/sulfurtransferase
MTSEQNWGGKAQLAAGVTWRRVGADLFLYGDEILALRDAGPELEAMIVALEAGVTLQEALGTGGAAGEDVLKLLERMRYIVPQPTTRWRGTRLDRQVAWLSAMGLDAEDAQERLCAARVAIFGVGGIGSVVLQHLIAAGVERLVLIDADRVEPSNLNRQPIYTPAQVGKLKVEAAAAYVAQHAPTAEVELHPCSVASCDALCSIMSSSPGPWDLLVIAADRPIDLVAGVVSPFCRTTGVPAVGASCGLRSARWGPLITQEGLPDDSLEDSDLPPPAPHAMAASFGPTNAIVAGFLAKDVVTLLAGGVPECRDTVMVLDFERASIRPVRTGRARHSA